MDETSTTPFTSRSRPPESYRDFFDLQLRLAEVISTRSSIPLADAVLLYTNFHRRFGLGPPGEERLHASWHDYTRQLSHLTVHADRVALTQAFYTEAPDEPPEFPHPAFGCFEFGVDALSGTVRLHFYNRDPEGPLSRARVTERLRELRDLFAHVALHCPVAKRVESRSWLYGIEAYRRLFPVSYVRSTSVFQGDSRFQGMSRWGQFLNHKGEVRSDLKDVFLRNLDQLDLNAMWRVFPLPTLCVEAPIGIFFTHFESGQALR